MNGSPILIILFMLLIMILVASVVSWQMIEYEYQKGAESCNACLTENKIPCTFGNCTEQKETVNDCCPQCWVDLEGMVES